MRPTPVPYLKKLLKTFHQPLPLSPRESDRLLKKLTSSFRKHLDAEHGPLSDESHQKQPPAQDASSIGAAAASSGASSMASIQGVLRSQVASSTSRRDTPTNVHVRNILSNPLLGAFSEPSSATSKQPTPAGGEERNPMATFELAVAKGMANPRLAAGCLRATRLQLAESHPKTLSAAMAESRAGSKVLQWLQFSGNERKILRVHPVLKSLRQELLRFLVAEGQEYAVWSWFEELAAKAGAGGDHHHHHHRNLVAAAIQEAVDAAAEEDKAANNGPPSTLSARQLLLEFVDCKARAARESGETSLDPAFQCLVHAKELAASTITRDPTALTVLLFFSWRHICWEATVNAWKQPGQATARPFEMFSSLEESFPSSWRDQVRLDKAHLALHHPTNPDHSPALGLLHSTVLSDGGLYKGESAADVRRIRSIGNEVYARLARQGHEEEAESFFSRVSQFLNGAIAWPKSSGRSSPYAP